MESVSPLLGVIIMMNNYFHDVATGLVVASAVAIYYILKGYEDSAGFATAEYFVRVYALMVKVAKYSLWWVIIAGFPRTYFYKRFEWANDVAGLQVWAIIVKHVVVVFVLGAAIYVWHKYHGRVRMVRSFLKNSGQVAGR